MQHYRSDMVEYIEDFPILVFADTPGALERARRSAGTAGLRVVHAGLVSEAIDAVSGTVPLFLDLEGAPAGPALLALLDRIHAGAEAGCPSVISSPPALIDIVATRAFHSGIAQLCAPDERERVTALRLAALPRPPRLHDVSREGDALMQQALLHQLSEEVGRIAGILASLSDDDEAVTQRRTFDAQGEEEAGIDPTQIRAIIRARRLRDQFFRSDLFADPAWDMLLDLMAARIEKSRVAVSSLCIAAAVPATTALRWIKLLTDRGLFLRAADPQVGRRVYIELSDEAARGVAAYLRAVQRIAPSVI